MRELDMTYTQYINFQIKSQFENYHHSVFYGQNIVAGSRISGLGAGLENVTGASAINTTNSENSLMGMGFGLSLSGIPALFLMKQHDFALLGLDQLVNTNNVLRQGRLKSPFLVVMVVVDSGFEGPQATLSSLDEFASLTKAPVNFLSTKETIDEAFKQALKPGLHFLAVGQTNMKKKVLESVTPTTNYPGVILYEDETAENFERSIALVFYGVDVEIGLSSQNSLQSHGIRTDLFVVCELSKGTISSNFMDKLNDYSEIAVIDTGKSEIHYSTELAFALCKQNQNVRTFHRTPISSWSEVSDDSPEFSTMDIVNSFLLGDVNE